MLDIIKPSVIIYNEDLPDGMADLGDFVQSININNSIQQPVGSCQITFNPVLNIQSGIKLSNIAKNGIRSLLKKNSFIVVKINRKERVKFIGFIDHIAERISSNNNSTAKTITINCSMLLPKLLVKDTIVNIPQLQYLQKIKSDPILQTRAEFFQWMRGLMKDGSSAFAGEPEKAIKWILNNAPATNGLSINVGGKKISVQTFITDSKDYTGQPAKHFKFLKNDFLYAPQLTTYAGTILNYLWSCIDKDFYEMYFDATETDDNMPVCKMVIRPKPFTYEKLDNTQNGWIHWEQLPRYEIDSTMRLDEMIGQSDFEVRNVFQCYYQMDLVASPDSNLSKYGYQFPIVNVESIKQYGLRDLVARSILMNHNKLYEQYKDLINQGKIADVIQLADKEIKDPMLDKRNKLMYWYAYPHFESGHITLIGGDYRIGNRLLYKDKWFYDEEEDKYIQGVEYYIEAVQDKFRYPNFYTTTLSLTRGAPEGHVAKWFNKHDKDFDKIDNLMGLGSGTNSNSSNETKLSDQDIKQAREQVDKIISELRNGVILNVEQ